jgi:hypothetical protein
MRVATLTAMVAALAVGAAGCDDTVAPGAGAWRSSWSHPLPHGATIRGIGGPGDFNQWAVGDGGLIVHYRGLGWSAVPSPTTRALRDVVAFSDGAVFMVGDGGTIIGPGLRAQASPTTSDLYALFGYSANNLIAVGAGGAIVANDGGGWQTVATPTTSDLFGVWGLVNGEVIAVGAGGTVIRAVGGVWSAVPPFTARDLNAVWADKPGDWFAVGDGGEIWHDDGSGWATMASPRTDDLYDVFGSDSAYVFAVGDADSILFYDQIAWRALAPNPSGHLDAISATLCEISASDPRSRDALHCSNTHFAGAGGALARYTLLGNYEVPAVVGWRRYTASDALGYSDLRGVHGHENGDVYAAGDGGALLRHGGAAWSLSPTGVAEDLHDVFAVSPLDVFVVGDGGRALRGADGAWVPIATGSASALRGVWGRSGSQVYAVGDGGTVLRFDGADWSAEAAPTADYTDVWGFTSGEWGFTSGEPIAVARGGVVVQRSAGAWAPMTPALASDLYGVWGRSPRDAYAVGAAGVILRLDAGGWRAMASGVSDDVVAVSGRGSAVWVVTRSGTALRLEGTSWRVETSPAVTGYGGVFVHGADRVYATGSTGVVIRFQWEPLGGGARR